MLDEIVLSQVAPAEEACICRADIGGEHSINKLAGIPRGWADVRSNVLLDGFSDSKLRACVLHIDTTDTGPFLCQIFVILSRPPVDPAAEERGGGRQALPTTKELRARPRTSAANCQLLYEGG